MSFDKFHGLGLKLNVNYVTPDMFTYTSPLLAPFPHHRANGCLAGVMEVHLLVSLIVAAVTDVPLLVVAVPFLPLIGKNKFFITSIINSITYTVIIGEVFIINGPFFICLGLFASVTGVKFILQ